MPANRVQLSNALRAEYQQLFDSCSIRPERLSSVDRLIGKIQSVRSRYESVQQATGVPWFFTAVVHTMEASLDFNKHLHNGDPLTARTVRVPKGRPKVGNPPFTWEESAADALTLKNLHQWRIWSLPETLYQLENYNGWGYRLYRSPVRSPYLWSFSRHYTAGKYVADGQWSDTAVSQQCGAAVLLWRMAEKGVISFSDQADLIAVTDLITVDVSPVPKVATLNVTHVVRTGDSLWSIARHFYGDGTKWPLLAQANELSVVKPRHIRPGEKLKVPKLEEKQG